MKMISSAAFLFILPAPLFADEYIPKPKNPENLKAVEAIKSKSNLIFQGNLAVDTDILLKEAHLSPDEIVKPDRVQTILNDLEKYYKTHGYTLARIESRASENGFEILIDEGALASIHVLGLGWYETFWIRNNILPYTIFNQFRIESVLSEWSQQKNLKVQYEIETIEPDKKPAPLTKIFNRVSSIEAIDKVRDHLHEEARYNLYIYFGNLGELQGFRYGFGYSSSNGIEVDGEWAREPLAFKSDRMVRVETV
jgi:hypothetical protein